MEKENNQSEPSFFLNCVYPKNFREKFLSGKNFTLKSLANTGMVLSLTCEQTDEEEMQKIIRAAMSSNSRVIHCNLDDAEDEFKTLQNFSIENKKLGNVLFWIFKKVGIFSTVFSKEKNKEFNKIEEQGKSPPSLSFSGWISELANGKIITTFLSTHKFLCEGYYKDEICDEQLVLFKKFLKGGVSFKDRPVRNQITKSIRYEVFKRDDFKCLICGNGKEVGLHIHHKIPISRGGTDDMENLATLCSACNTSISNRIYDWNIKKWFEEKKELI